MSRTVAYTTRVKWRNGSEEILNRRERPQLLFAADGVTPLMLTNGAQHGGLPEDCNNGGTVTDPACRSFTLGTTLKQVLIRRSNRAQQKRE